jgi:thioredoxin 1
MLLAWPQCIAAAMDTTAFLLSGVPQAVPVEGTITLVNFGSATCPPCKAMAPFISELSTLYEGRVAMVYIDVGQYRQEAVKHGIQAIPTQVFYDARGQERYRHTGFISKSEIITILTELEQ